MKTNSLDSWTARYGWPLLILLLAAVLRFHDLTLVPPGITHDEADHGLTAWQIVTEGVREIYFTVGYGREPLYDYAVALFMSFMGPTIFAARLVSVFAGLIFIAAMIAWVWRAFDRPTALLTGAGLAVGFWPLMSSRQALRSIMLPSLFVFAVLLFWLAMENVNRSEKSRDGFFWCTARGLLPFIVAGAVLGLTFYTYIPARALWTIFPLLLLYWLLRDRELWWTMYWRTAVMLLIMAVVAAPLLIYLQSHPAAELRIQQLAQPLLLARDGNWTMLIDQTKNSLRLFFFEGDPVWRYNLYKRPFLNPVFGFLFLVGLAQALWWAITNRRSVHHLPGSASFFSLSWLVVGFAPVLITGPELSMTQAVAVQPLVYLFPALALASAGAWLARRTGRLPLLSYKAGVALLYCLLLGVTWRDYFQEWANHPQVRVQYESTLITAIDFLNEVGSGEALISTITPGRFHSPAVAAMTLTNENVDLSWFDGRGSLLLPTEELATMVIPGFTPLPTVLSDYLETAELVQTLPMRENDLDRPVQIYQLYRQEMLDDWHERLTPVDASFADAVKLIGFDLIPEEASPGQQVSLITMWQAQKPLDEAVFFTHLLGPDGAPLAQSDQLNVPGYSWSPGEIFLQLHQFILPADIQPGVYPLAVGVYTLPSGERLPLTADASGATLFPLTTLTVAP
jgi:4-amino-4-deoxy-L-arabinose transferase-like glycosyltransferase